MNKQISPKLITLTFGILVVSFLAVFYAFAWQEPTQTPPGGNVATPLNVSATAQTKVGDLTVNGILTTLRDLVVDVVTIKGNGAMSLNLNSDKVDDYHAADLLAQGAATPLYTTKCSWTCSDYSRGTLNSVGWISSLYCTSSCVPPSCAVGDTSLVTGCVVNGGGLVCPSEPLFNTSGTCIFNNYGYCERVCRDE